MTKHAKRVGHLGQIVQRLTHAHEHQSEVTGVARPELMHGDQDLSDDLVGQQVTAEAHARRSAERAAHGAADLARNAERDSTRAWHVHGLDSITPLPGGQFEQQFGRTVCGTAASQQTWWDEREPSAQCPIGAAERRRARAPGPGPL